LNDTVSDSLAAVWARTGKHTTLPIRVVAALLELLLLQRLGANLQHGASRQVSETVRAVLHTDQLLDHEPHVRERLPDLSVLRQRHSRNGWLAQMKRSLGSRRHAARTLPSAILTCSHESFLSVDCTVTLIERYLTPSISGPRCSSSNLDSATLPRTSARYTRGTSVLGCSISLA
jgi:hypothetical protein